MEQNAKKFSRQLQGMVELSLRNGGPLNVVVKDHTKLTSSIDQQVKLENMVVTKESELAGKVKDPKSNLGAGSKNQTGKETKGSTDKNQSNNKNNNSDNKRKN
jgi:hypothetical protein